MKKEDKLGIGSCIVLFVGVLLIIYLMSQGIIPGRDISLSYQI